ncbi:RING finger protein 150, partial [Neolamprologus brichardi]|uniref:RING finger protein 150 n=1 Tax=Neolamprologus brichardi TaxID=32507 RepID=UPI0016436DB4
DPNTRFAVPAQTGAWVALIARGNCTYKDKIRHAAAHNASAVVIFNVGSTNTNDTITMPHPGNGKSPTHERRLGDAAKKAISKLQLRTIRKGDQETEPDFDNCAVCIEGYKANDVVRILPCRHLFHKSCVDPWLLDHRTCPMCKMNILKALGIAVSVKLGFIFPRGVRRVGLPQDYQDPDTLRDSPVTTTTDTHTGELQPMASSASVASFVIAVETGLSDEEVSLEQPQLVDKS